MKTPIRYLLAVLYFSFVMYAVFFARRRANLTWEQVKEYANLIPLKSKIVEYNNIESKGDTENFYSNLAGNIILFMPYPFVMAIFLNRVYYKAFFISGMLISMLIEILQFFLAIGIPDIDDVILNTSGVLIGIAILYTAENVTMNKTT